MKLDLMTLDLVEAAAAVAHAAASQLYGVFNETDGYDWPGTGLEGDALATEIYGMACYTASKQAGGEQLWIQCRMRGMINDGMPESRAFADVEQSRKWAFLLFCETFKPLLDKLAIERGRREELRLAEGRKAPAPPKIEDTIFEPIGSMNEMEPHALDFLKNLSKPKAPAPEMPPAIVEHDGGAQMQPINLGAPSEEETANQQPQAGTNAKPEAGGTPQADALVQNDGDTATENDGHGQQGEPDGAAGDADQPKEPVKPTVEDAEKAKNSRTGTKRKRN